MTMLAALNSAYARLAARGEAPAYGFSTQNIGFAISLLPDGTPEGPPIDLREKGKKKLAKPLDVPQPPKRTSGIAPCFLWDKTAYVLGVTAKEAKRTAREHEAFVAYHCAALAGTLDPGLRAFLAFLDGWRPERFDELGWPEEMKDQNVVFRVGRQWLHEREAARVAWARLADEGEGRRAPCLVTGETARVATLHPSIKGVWGAQSSGASIVSFNVKASESYGNEQGDNAPVSEAAAFGYTTALNVFLAGKRNRIQIGDASTVFWAEAPEEDAAAAEDAFRAMFGGEAIDESMQSAKVRPILQAIAEGRPIATAVPDLAEGVRFFVLGLAPNASRLSIRFWLEDEFGAIARRYDAYREAMRIEPPPKDAAPPIWRCLIEIAAQRKSENVPPQLAGEWLHRLLTGTPLPNSLLAALLIRLRVDKDVNALRAALLKAILVSQGQEVPVSLDPENRNPGYLLGRLFAAYEYAQSQALGGKVNATIRDRYYGTASACPRSVFPVLQRNATHHLAALRKEKRGLWVTIDKTIGEIFERAAPEAMFPATLTSQNQALFAIGYYHQRNIFFAKKPEAEKETAAILETTP